mgnify:CR=1 FL=1
MRPQALDGEGCGRAGLRVVAVAVGATAVGHKQWGEFDAGELIKFGHKGIVVKTYEGEISQGISGAQIFKFSVMDQEQEVIEKMKKHQGQYVKLSYVERFSTFFFWGDSKYFITEIVPEKSPHFNRE